MPRSLQLQESGLRAGQEACPTVQEQQQLAVEFAFSLFSTQFKNENHQRQTATGHGAAKRKEVA